MRTWALVPQKRFDDAKSRLARPDRGTLARSMFERVLSVLAACELEGTLVATNGADVARVARTCGAAVLRDRATSLASIIDAGIVSLRAAGATHVVVLMADLPLLVPEDVTEIVRALRGADVVASPDRFDEGTNAVGVATSADYPTCFGGGDSFARHRMRARERGASFAVRYSRGLAFDVDVACDAHRL